MSSRRRHVVPPISAFQSLPLSLPSNNSSKSISPRSNCSSKSPHSSSKSKRTKSTSSKRQSKALEQQKQQSHPSTTKTPIDPFESLLLLNHSGDDEEDEDEEQDGASIISSEQSSCTSASNCTTVSTATTVVTSNFRRHWITSNNDDSNNDDNNDSDSNTKTTLYETSCFASFVMIFASPTAIKSNNPPPLAVVKGLWSQVVLPPLMIHETKIPELVAQDVWTVLSTQLGYLQLTTNGRVCISTNTNTTTISRTAIDICNYGQELAAELGMNWELPFVMYLKDALMMMNNNTDHNSPTATAFTMTNSHHDIRYYAAEELMNRLLALKQVKEAGKLLHQPSFARLLMLLYLKDDTTTTTSSSSTNILQLTQHMTTWIEQYLRLLPSTHSVWQEALGLYQGWHRILVQEWNNVLAKTTPTSTNTTPPTTTASPTVSQPMAPKFLILGRAMFTLSMSLDSILVVHPTADPYMKVLWVRQFAYMVESLKLFGHVNGDHSIAMILSAASWISLSETCATLNESGMEHTVCISNGVLDEQEDGGEGEKSDEQVKCLKMALTLLKKSHMVPQLELHVMILLAEAKDCLGRWMYDRGQYVQAIVPLEETVKVIRQILVNLRDAATPTSPSSSSLFRWVRPAAHSVQQQQPQLSHSKIEEFDDLRIQLCLKKPTDGTAQQIAEMEVGLSGSLEYLALALHASGQSLLALTYLEEAITLKYAHLGKHSLELARIHAAMAVVHDDLEQWEEGLSRCRNCLRIRMHHLSQFPHAEWFSKHEELFRGILENIRSMGNFHRMLGDHDNAIGCYWKIAAMSRKEWENQQNDPAIKTVFCGFENHRHMGQDFRINLPLPALVFDEERYTMPGKSPSMTKRITERPESFKPDATDEENAVLREAAQAYQTILSLFKDKVFALGEKTGSVNLASAIPIDDVPVLLVASCQLGFIHIHFGDYRSAISSLQHCLECLWILDSAHSGSSGSDSYDSQSDIEQDEQQQSKRKKTQVLHGIFGHATEVIDGELIFHALGICRAACGEFDQAVRFHLTALRYAQSVYGVNSLRASEILYDAAVSYWYLHEYEKALEFWLCSAQILTSNKEKEKKYENSGVNSLGAHDVDTSMDNIQLAKISYNMGACCCAMGKYDNPKTLAMFSEAMEFFGVNAKFRIAKANCLFYISVIDFRHASQSRNSSLMVSARNKLQQAVRIYRANGYLRQHNQNLPHQVLQAHIRFMQGRISFDQGKLKEASGSYTIALNLYRELSKDWELHEANVLNELGRLHMKLMLNDVALKYFGESLAIRRDCLGSDHEAVGKTLYHMADIYARMDQFGTSMQIYNESLRIQLRAEGNESAAVAMTLLKMGALYARHNLLNEALEKLHGSVRIRRDRAMRVGMTARGTSNIDLAEDFLNIMNNGQGIRDEQDLVRQALHTEAIKEEIALAIAYHCLGNLYVKKNDYTLAKESYQNSLLVRRRHPVKLVIATEGHKMHAADTLHNLGCIYELEGTYDMALKYYVISLKLKQGYKVLVSTGSEVGAKEEPTSQIVLCDGEFSLEASYLQFLGSLSYAATLNRIGSIHYRRKNSDVAAACFNAALNIQKLHLGDDHFIVARTLSDMGSALFSVQDRRAEALECYRESLQIRKRRPTNALCAADSVQILYRMGNLHDLNREYSTAVTCYREAIAIYGRRYVSSAGRSLCRYLLLRHHHDLPVSSDEVKDHVQQHAFASNIFKMEAIPPTKIIDDKTGPRSERFGTIAAAMYYSYKKQDGFDNDNSILLDLNLNTSGCWISLELYVLNLAKLMRFLATRWRTEVEGGIGMRDALRQILAQNDVGKNSTGSDHYQQGEDEVAFQMLCLIQE